ncbi:hypothetical protein T07_9833 [Trichinella nelsoni]|nr:hypothetical protein T07_7 [Trichinella nelsoni]KRX19753.1 hypothetical protein T07_9833 [Trichinella nelsoni]
MVLGSCSTFKVTALLGFIWLELLWQSRNVYDHTTLKAPHPARSAKLSNVGLTSVPESETVWEHAVS